MGIFIADAAASGHWKPLDDLIGTRNVTTANVTQLMEDFLTAGQWTGVAMTYISTPT